jgi:arabinofuranan 3-O-arabinosyltransferase
VLPLLALTGFVLLRRLWWSTLPVSVLAAVSLATGVAVVGRLLGHGQAWALGAPAQAATLVAIIAVVASGIRPSPAERRGPRLFLE